MSSKPWEVQPAESEVDTTVQATIKKGFEADQLCIENVPGYDRLRDILNGLGIAYLDLLPSYRKAMRVDGANPFRKSDHHWNSVGHALAAKLVMRHMIDKRLLRAGEWR